MAAKAGLKHAITRPQYNVWVYIGRRFDARGVYCGSSRLSLLRRTDHIIPTWNGMSPTKLVIRSAVFRQPWSRGTVLSGPTRSPSFNLLMVIHTTTLPLEVFTQRNFAADFCDTVPYDITLRGRSHII